MTAPRPATDGVQSVWPHDDPECPSGPAWPASSITEQRSPERDTSQGLTLRTYVRYGRATRCPVHGTQEPEDEQHPVCPIAIGRTIAGKVDEGICGQPLEGPPNED
jgi:hypothetical protein